MAGYLFAGGRFDSLVAVSGVPAETTTAGKFDASYADCAVETYGTTNPIGFTFLDASNAPVNLTTGQTLWLHFEVAISGTGSPVDTQSMCVLYDSSAQPWFQIRAVGTGGNYGLFYNSGTGGSPAWTQVGSSFALANGVRHMLDLTLTLGSPHFAALYSGVGGTLLTSGSFTQASLTTLRQGRFFSSLSGGWYMAFSQVIATEGISTIGAKLKTARATGAGTNSGFSSAAASNVNEAVNNDATIDTSNAAGQKQTYAMGDVTVPSGYRIAAVHYWLRAKSDGSSPANIKPVIRSGGTDYAGSNLPGLSSSLTNVLTRYNTDPATGVAWTQAGWNAAEAGYESAA